jgi:drug/metabolite transporter (DMT)-like permease
MKTHNSNSSITLGAIYIVLSMLGAASLGAVVKWASGGFSSEFLASLRFLAGLLVFVSIFLFFFRGRISLKTDVLKMQAAVALAWVLGVLIYYVSIRFVPLMDATLLLNTAAIFGPILARFFDGKRESMLVWVGTMIGFVGIVVVLRPGPQLFENPMSLIGILAGFFAGLRLFLNSKIKGEPSQRTTFYSLLFGTAFCLIILLAVGLPIRVPSWEAMLFTPREMVAPLLVDSSLIGVLIIFGVLSMLSPFLLAKGLSHATVGQISPFRYSGVIFAGILDWIFWSVEPTWSSYAGLALVLGGSMIILRGKIA